MVDLMDISLEVYGFIQKKGSVKEKLKIAVLLSHQKYLTLKITLFIMVL